MKKTTSILAIASVLACGLALAGPQGPTPDVTEVAVSGLERVSEQLVRSQLEVKTGQAYDPNAVARDLRRLYGLGYFNTIKVDATRRSGGLRLTYVFDEKKIVGEIKIIGNKKMRERKIRAVLSCKEGASFTPDVFDDERQAILDLYKEKGFANTSVDITVEKVGPSRVRLNYVLDEGKKARIRHITIEGNETISDRKLRKLMKTKRAWLFFGGRYNEDQFEADLESIIEEYGDVGRLEADIAETDLEYSGNRRKMEIGISIKEGPEYTVEQLEVARNEVYDDDEVLDIIEVQAGDVHNKSQLEEDAGLIEKGYMDSGYVNADVVAQVTLDRDKKTTHVVHNVREGDLKYIREIDIAGNSVTKDDIIRRQMLVMPGERVDGSAVRVTEQRIRNTDYFDNVRLTLRDSEHDDLFSDLLVDVEEGKTGNFNFGAGYSTEEKLGGFLELRFNNFDIANWPSFSGGGQVFSTRLQLGSVRDRYNLSFTDPEIGGYPVAFGFDVFDESYDYSGSDVADYQEETKGGQIRFAKSLSPYVTVRTGFRFVDTDYSHRNWLWIYHPLLEREFEESTTVSNTWGIERNTLDIHRDPSRGSKHDLVATVAGFGGDHDFFKIEHDSSWYRPLDDEQEWILSLRLREGWADSYGSSDYVPMSDRFFAGGTSTIRGFDTRDVGPRIREYRIGCINFGSKVPLGGELRLLNNLELKHKLNDTFRLYAFVDSGGVWETASDFDFGDMKYSTGVGFGVDIPRMGPIRVDYGVPLNPEDDQGSGRLHLMTGLRF